MGEGWPKIACPFRTPVVLYEKLVIFNLLSMKWWMCATLFLHISTSLGCFCPRTISFSKRKLIGQVTSNFLYMRFTYYTKINQQDYFRRSNWFPWRYLVPWMNHWPPVWWPDFRIRSSIVSCCESLIWWKWVFLLIYYLFSWFTNYPSFAYYFSNQINLLAMLFILSSLYWNLYKCNLYSF